MTKFQAFELKEKLQEKLKKSREEAEERKKEVEQLQSKVRHSICLIRRRWYPSFFRLLKVRF